MVNWFKLFRKSERGLGMVEYSLILSLVAIVSIVALAGIGKGANSIIATVAGGFDDVNVALSSAFMLSDESGFSANPERHLATDDEFYGEKNGSFKYIGSKDVVYIPHEIKGVAVTSYKYMFSDTDVSKVISDNDKVTDMSGMFRGSSAEVLDLSSLDASSVSNVNGMFLESSATTVLARTDKDVEKFNDKSETGAPKVLTFIIE